MHDKIPLQWTKVAGPDFIRRTICKGQRVKEGNIYSVLQSAKDERGILRCQVKDDRGDTMWAVVADNSLYWEPVSSRTLEVLGVGHQAPNDMKYALSYFDLGWNSLKVRNEEKPMRKVTIETKVLINGRPLEQWNSDQVIDLITEEQSRLTRLDDTGLESPGIKTLRDRHRENISKLDEALLLVLENEESDD